MRPAATVDFTCICRSWIKSKEGGQQAPSADESPDELLMLPSRVRCPDYTVPAASANDHQRRATVWRSPVCSVCEPKSKCG